MCVCVRLLSSLYWLQDFISDQKRVDQSLPLVARADGSDEGRVGAHCEVGLCTLVCKLSLDGGGGV